MTEITPQAAEVWRCPECGSDGPYGCGADWHDTVSTPSVAALAEALCATSFLADWYERAEVVVEKLAENGWRLIHLAGTDA